MGGPEAFDQQVFDAISAGLTDASAVVRHKAVLAVFYTRWPRFLPLLEDVAAGDPYGAARTDAALAADSIRNPQPYPS
ncbi:hypothetical protein [Rhizomonospora bruguierae]|uniref:hypothetical protein n=1 Tax=Rhizomonospora bruguierae TaxID=1581705 RepID=UPI001BCA8CD6|nr:hypothetical protein [Micromonospora sp. NBRC 107566]